MLEVHVPCTCARMSQSERATNIARAPQLALFSSPARQRSTNGLLRAALQAAGSTGVPGRPWRGYQLGFVLRAITGRSSRVQRP